jgi:hypothetical protein
MRSCTNGLVARGTAAIEPYTNVQYIYCVCMAILYICFEIYIYVMSAVVYLLRVPFEVYVERFGIDQ